VIYAVPAILLFAIAVIIKYDPAHTSAQYLIVRACLLGHAKQPAAVQQSAQADLPESGRFWNVVAVLPSCHRESSCPCSAGGLPHALARHYHACTISEAAMVECKTNIVREKCHGHC